MNIVVTGAQGFIGKNLVHQLFQAGIPNMYLTKYDVDSSPTELVDSVSTADIVVNLAGINRPSDISDFDKGNRGFTELLLEKCMLGKKPRIILSSSSQALLGNPYGISKLGAEEAVRQYSRDNSIKSCIIRLPNVFGKWSKPNYNSAVATFCHNIANGLPIQIDNPDAEISLVYIDDVCRLIIGIIRGEVEPDENLLVQVNPVYKTTVGNVANSIEKFCCDRIGAFVPESSDGFEKKLYSTYLSFLPKDGFSTAPKMNTDERGSFTELIKTLGRGQVSVNVTKPGIIRGNHWHHTKNEKFIVVSGEGIIKLRNVNEEEILNYRVNGDHIEIIDIPVGYTHSIANTGNDVLVTIMWASELFDPDNPDTYPLEV